MTEPWSVTRDGVAHELRIESDKLHLDGPEPDSLAWDTITDISFPTSFSCSISGTSSWVLGFANRHERARFEHALSGRTSDVGSPLVSTPPTSARHRISAVQLLTTPDISGTHFEVLGMITANVVISRNSFSDFGSDVKSALGGNLVGIEKAMTRGMEEAKTRLREAAWTEGGDAVVAVSVAIASVNDKAEAIVLSGTAVRTDTRLAEKRADVH